MNRQTFWCLATLARLAALQSRPRSGLLESEWPASLPLRGWVYLWTFTLPGQNASLNELANAWSAFMKNRARDCPSFQGVRVFEPSPTERWHAHAITLKRLDVSTLRQHVSKYGFGRINVRRIPASKVGYVCKYLAKSHWWCGTEHRRMYCAVGCKGIPPSDIQMADSWVDYVTRATPLSAGMFEPWRSRSERALKIWLDSTMELPQQKQQ
jgi:hypothetical protein